MSGAAPCPRPSMMVSGTVLHFYIYPEIQTPCVLIVYQKYFYFYKKVFRVSKNIL